MSKAKALILLSGGLDSMLAAKLIIDQGIETVGLCFVSNFYNAEKAKKAAQQLNIELIESDISQEMLKIVKNPPNGYGKNMNPCIDCHGFMFKKAGIIAKEKGFDFIATGEVLGQRPFSQNKEALSRVAKLAGVEVLRPLCAKLLPETEIEKSGLVIRGKLKDIQGRTRDQQMELVNKYKLEEYPSPAGGCILTDPEFSERLIKMLDYWPECTSDDVELLKNGRTYWFTNSTGEHIILIIGRHHNDNSRLEELAKKGDCMLELKEITGPTSLIRRKTMIDFCSDTEIAIPEKIQNSKLKLGENKSDEEIFDIACLLTGYYAVKARGKKVQITCSIIK